MCYIFIETRCATMDGRSAHRDSNAVTCGETYKYQARFKLEIPACARPTRFSDLNRPPVSVLFLITRLQSFYFFLCDICRRTFPIDERCIQQDSYSESTVFFESTVLCSYTVSFPSSFPSNLFQAFCNCGIQVPSSSHLGGAWLP
jgi:hypothetical protein